MLELSETSHTDAVAVVVRAAADDIEPPEENHQQQDNDYHAMLPDLGTASRSQDQGQRGLCSYLPEVPAPLLSTKRVKKADEQ